jgi:hypothetical protein
VTQAARTALQETPEERVFQVGDYVEGMVAAWQTATKEERRELLRMALQAVYVDMASATVVAIKAKPAFLLLFCLREPGTAGSPILVAGDPEGARGRLAQMRLAT